VSGKSQPRVNHARPDDEDELKRLMALVDMEKRGRESAEARIRSLGLVEPPKLHDRVLVRLKFSASVAKASERWCVARVLALALQRGEVEVEVDTAVGRKEKAWIRLFDIIPNLKHAHGHPII